MKRKLTSPLRIDNLKLKLYAKYEDTENCQNVTSVLPSTPIARTMKAIIISQYVMYDWNFALSFTSEFCLSSFLVIFFSVVVGDLGTERQDGDVVSL